MSLSSRFHELQYETLRRWAEEAAGRRSIAELLNNSSMRMAEEASRLASRLAYTELDRMSGHVEAARLANLYRELQATEVETVLRFTTSMRTMEAIAAQQAVSSAHLDEFSTQERLLAAYDEIHRVDREARALGDRMTEMSGIGRMYDQITADIVLRIREQETVAQRLCGFAVPAAEYLTNLQSRLHDMSSYEPVFRSDAISLLHTGSAMEVHSNLSLLDRFSYGRGEANDDESAIPEYRDADDVDEFCATLLRINPALPNMWRGALQALDSDNSDRERHAIVSLRELVTHVLHALAPDEDLRTWSSDEDHFRDGRPTREARLLYICAPINVGEFADFVKSDVRSHGQFIRILNAATHRIPAVLSDAQLGALLHRTKSLIEFLIKIRTQQLLSN